MGKKAGLAGKTEEEELQAEVILEHSMILSKVYLNTFTRAGHTPHFMQINESCQKREEK